MTSIRRWWKQTNLRPIGKPRIAYIIKVISGRSNADLATKYDTIKVLNPLCFRWLYSSLSWHLAYRAGGKIGLATAIFVLRRHNRGTPWYGIICYRTADVSAAVAPVGTR